MDGEFCIGVFSNTTIPSGAELTYDYRFESFGPMQRCLCGSKNCRGFIGLNKKVDSRDAACEDEGNDLKKKNGKKSKEKKKLKRGKVLKNSEVAAADTTTTVDGDAPNSKFAALNFRFENESEDACEIIWWNAQQQPRRSAVSLSPHKRPLPEILTKLTHTLGMGSAALSLDLLNAQFRETMRLRASHRSSHRFLIRNVKKVFSKGIFSKSNGKRKTAHRGKNIGHSENSKKKKKSLNEIISELLDHKHNSGLPFSNTTLDADTMTIENVCIDLACFFRLFIIFLLY